MTAIHPDYAELVHWAAQAQYTNCWQRGKQPATTTGGTLTPFNTDDECSEVSLTMNPIAICMGNVMSTPGTILCFEYRHGRFIA